MRPDQVDLDQWRSFAQQILGDDFFDDFYSSMEKEGPAYNVYTNASEIMVLVSLPYITDLSQVKLTVKEQEVYLKGHIDLGFEHMQQVAEGIFSGHFEITVPLPQIVNQKKVNAQYKKGILQIQLFPKLRKDGKSVQIADTE
ncbi:Hsp20/alpha crystallin family protein [Caldalkalibacillus salinus]|uniref:Hsp20/alpha crystallin family protein n=1 Tax=Caldalkalibacillus salinus TaxID=2803787 RepID=UPI00192162B7|nr:Hsp20/alpha crystallin family protein [Caldalkalibacillus salinus]